METVSELPDLSATELRRRIVTREVTVTEVVEATLERVARLNPQLNAIVTPNPDALEDAARLDRRIQRRENPGVLCGLTVGIKDVTPVAGLRTTFGSPIYADHVPREDAVVVRRLREAGAVIVGKTNCPEFAAGANTFNDVFGRTRNPWNSSKSAGGSTGGGAAAVATGMIALAEGTDLGGSLRIPAAFCGVVGLRPSVGLVPTHPTDWTWDTLQVTGPIARTAEDVGLMLEAIAGPSDHSPYAQPVQGRSFVAAAADRQHIRRVAYCSDVAGIGVDPDVERVCREAAFALKDRGIAVEEIDLDLSAARPAFISLRGLWFVTQMFSRLDMQDRFGANVGNNVRSGLEVSTQGPCRGGALSRASVATVPRIFRQVRPPAHSMRRRVPISRRTELPGHHCRPADENVHRLDSSDLCLEPDRPPRGVRTCRAGFQRNARRSADRRQAVR